MVEELQIAGNKEGRDVLRINVIMLYYDHNKQLLHSTTSCSSRIRDFTGFLIVITSANTRKRVDLSTHKIEARRRTMMYFHTKRRCKTKNQKVDEKIRQRDRLQYYITQQENFCGQFTQRDECYMVNKHLQ